LHSDLPHISKIRILDIGAMFLEGAKDPYMALVEQGVAEVIGFEPVDAEYQKLCDMKLPGHTFFPYAIGDGTKQTFHQCNMSMTSSLLNPNTPLVSRFTGLSELMQVVEKSEIQTRRLDDLPEIGEVDFIKIDIQGAELAVFQGAPKTLQRTLALQTEIEFVPLYEQQPLFAEVDIGLRERGFYFHKFLHLAMRPFAPLRSKGLVNGQVLWGDAYFVKSFMQFGEMSVDHLLRLALILHYITRSGDLALHALYQVETKGGPRLWTDYFETLTGRKPAADDLSHR